MCEKVLDTTMVCVCVGGEKQIESSYVKTNNRNCNNETFHKTGRRARAALGNTKEKNVNFISRTVLSTSSVICRHKLRIGLFTGALLDTFTYFFIKCLDVGLLSLPSPFFSFRTG